MSILGPNGLSLMIQMGRNSMCFGNNVKARFFAQKALPKENAVISTTAYGIDV
jgi:hypothetical protein